LVLLFRPAVQMAEIAGAEVYAALMGDCHKPQPL